MKILGCLKETLAHLAECSFWVDWGNRACTHMAVIRAENGKHRGEVQVCRDEGSEEGSLIGNKFPGNGSLMSEL